MTTESYTRDLSETTQATGRAVVVPDKPALEGLEQTWAARWKADDTYAFDRSKSREQIYSIDTPPPTVSGSLHCGQSSNAPITSIALVSPPSRSMRQTRASPGSAT